MKSNTGHPFESKLHIDYSTNNHPPQLHAADDLDCCFMATLSWRKPVGPRIPWSNIITGQSANCVSKQTTKRWNREDNSRERGVESQLRTAAQRGHPNPEDAEDPMVAPPDCEIRQAGRVLELQNGDLWLRKTELSWHLLILMTSREEPFKNYRSKSSKEDKIEEAKKRRPREGDVEWTSAEWQPSFWSCQQPASSSPSSWQQ